MEGWSKLQRRWHDFHCHESSPIKLFPSLCHFPSFIITATSTSLCLYENYIKCHALWQPKLEKFLSGFPLYTYMDWTYVKESGAYLWRSKKILPEEKWLLCLLHNYCTPKYIHFEFWLIWNSSTHSPTHHLYMIPETK